eukprot:8393483-Pyramimonas_sp.AAC.1
MGVGDGVGEGVGEGVRDRESERGSERGSRREQLSHRPNPFVRTHNSEVARAERLEILRLSDRLARRALRAALLRPLYTRAREIVGLRGWSNQPKSLEIPSQRRCARDGEAPCAGRGVAGRDGAGFRACHSPATASAPPPAS